MTLSGAKIVKLPFVVIKYGDEAGEQSKLVQNLPHSPKVYASGQSWYAMEKLWYVGTGWPWVSCLEMLQDIWKLPATTGLDWEPQLRKLLTDRDSVLLEYMDAPCRELDGQPAIRTHGDPTWEHVMANRNKIFKLIDPIQRPYLPPNPVTDLAKMGQSLLGWEGIRYGWHIHKFMKREIREDIIEAHETDYLWFWTALCLQRINWRHPDGIIGAWCMANIQELVERKRLL